MRDKSLRHSIFGSGTHFHVAATIHWTLLLDLSTHAYVQVNRTERIYFRLPRSALSRSMNHFLKKEKLPGLSGQLFLAVRCMQCNILLCYIYLYDVL
jgi:hypothetical protein